MTLGSLFSGCGGLDLGLHFAGFELVWACESDRHAAGILSRHWPAVPVAPDVREVDAGFIAVDVLAGGFPCQDVSNAGKRAGLARSTRSGLWFEYARAIRVLRPRGVVVENVSGLFTAGFGIVMADLAEAGYDTRWACLRSADLFAPHGRDRVFIVATDADSSRRGEVAGSSHGDEESNDRRRSPDDHEPGRVGTGGLLAAAPTDTPHIGCERQRLARDGSGGSEDGDLAASNANGLGCEVRRQADSAGRPDVESGDASTEWGAYEPAIRRWESLTRASGQPTDARGRLMPEFVEWMMGFPEGWTEPASRTQRLKMLGNAIQVQSAELIGLATRELLTP